MVQLRYNILRKPLGLEFDPKELEKEREDILFGCFDDGKLEGCCMLTKTGPKEVRLRQMAVISGLQGKGIGKALIQFAENIARDRGYKTMMMHSRKTTCHFFEKQGYKIEGEEFIQLTIPHYKMVKKLR